MITIPASSSCGRRGLHATIAHAMAMTITTYLHCAEPCALHRRVQGLPPQAPAHACPHVMPCPALPWSQVVMVEEAGELLEAHVLTSLCPATKHLIMVGCCGKHRAHAARRRGHVHRQRMHLQSNQPAVDTSPWPCSYAIGYGPKRVLGIMHIPLKRAAEVCAALHNSVRG